MGEFDLIKRYFSRKSLQNDVVLSVGDDCAITSIPTGYQLAITTDTLVEGTHFLPSISPADLAYKSVAVNLSDLAAMGAKPTWMSLALTLPEIKEAWLAEFSQSLFAILDRYGVSLIGGDTTKGSLSITFTAQGFLPENKGLFRHQAKVGDWIFVSGFLGDSAVGLDLLLQNRKIENESDRYFIQRHLHPTPRVELGLALRSFSCCALDISDGLLADLEHILERSQVGAEIYLENLPLSRHLCTQYEQTQAEKFALTGGEDYELCFTVSEEKREEMEQVLRSQGIKVTCIGKILPQTSGLNLLKNGKKMVLPTHIGFDHFS
ncbi:thiamin-monophosphate kinase [Haemophilus parahaemolyticus HK385]|uniref:Thiamine-monophosphate kinase n=1 Tax=Haemophilus parahaemolyticus HK385 TaxID=1095744 RepID=A0ABN0EYH0_HAEPH|nr:thiamine-phosphate kinase [Haemophilus parahaemolyticus]EIJ67899.1 thiamine-phosphate kinase [Haemophilus parahaemolyticus HK385]OOR97248.1 thiamine-monophosphate kinase [Haemophilus parahaemolyticus]QRP12623.1 thiamine-phosphate kinase [Haemophilus parahaemolyticus]STO66578.1 thiamin-monophosphate kinase [Haemophilus parahaemolyticus HK385]